MVEPDNEMPFRHEEEWPVHPPNSLEESQSPVLSEGGQFLKVAGWMVAFYDPLPESNL